MTRSRASFEFETKDLYLIKKKVLFFIKDNSTFSFLDNNEYNIGPNRFELIAACGIQRQLLFTDIPDQKDWILGHINFEFQDEQPTGESTSFPPSNFYIPETVCYISFQSNVLVIESLFDAQTILRQVLQSSHIPGISSKYPNSWVQNVDQNTYLEKVEAIRTDIFLGKYYELNYCIPYSAGNVVTDPVNLFLQQNRINPAPFSALYRHKENYLICTSPERFLFKSRQDIYSQPIKGTAPRSGVQNEDEYHRNQLRNNIKEQAENVMIVDLTRSDLAQCCATGTVEVQELFGIYTFPFVHQMISTVRGCLLPEENFFTIFRKAFPMGSMTGAPKKTVIDHIRKYETGHRNIYSGCVFYHTPEGDFDSNVVIRSLVYNTTTQTLQFHIGSAITYDSNSEREWEELLWKAGSMKKALE